MYIVLHLVVGGDYVCMSDGVEWVQILCIGSIGWAKLHCSCLYRLLCCPVCLEWVSIHNRFTAECSMNNSRSRGLKVSYPSLFAGELNVGQGEDAEVSWQWRW